MVLFLLINLIMLKVEIRSYGINSKRGDSNAHRSKITESLAAQAAKKMEYAASTIDPILKFFDYSCNGLTKEAYIEIFIACDIDKDGILNRDEYLEFEKQCQTRSGVDLKQGDSDTTKQWESYC